MAQTGYTPILIYSSSTAAAAPAAGSLTNSTLGSELAINITDGKLFYKDNANAVQVIGWKVVPATAGGTGQTSYAVGDLLYADTTTSLAKLADVATGNALISGGVGVAPAWGKIGLTTHVTGTLPVANGGTGTATAFTAGSVVFAGASGVYSQNNANLFWDDTNNRLGVGTATPAVGLHVSGTSTTAIARIASTSNGQASFDGSGAGLEITAFGMNATSATYSPAIKFGSTDADFTTTNPKFGAAILAKASQTYNSDTTGGMDLLFWTSPINPGTGNGLVERMRITSSGNVGIGVTPTAELHIAAGAAAASSAPLKFTSGTNLTTPEAGAVEYDGTIVSSTPNTNYGRAAIPLTNYASGTGTALGTNTEATNAVLLPAANDTITLAAGTYFLDTSFIITRGATSTTSATARMNIRGTGTAVGNFSGMSLSAPTAGGATANFSFDAVTITTDNVLTAASITAAGVYTISLRGVLKITTGGTIIPQYSLSANINAAGTVAKVLYLRLQQMDTQSAAAAGPAGTGWG